MMADCKPTNRICNKLLRNTKLC